MIVGKDTSEPDKIMLFDALSKIDKHPLQDWAKQWYEVRRKDLDDLEKARKAQADAALQAADKNQSQMEQLQAEIDQLNAQLRISRDDLVVGQKLQEQLMIKVSQLALLKGKIGELQLQTVSVSTTRTGPVVTNIDAILTVSVVKASFPATPSANIAVNLPYILAAIKEFKISDPKMIAAVFGTIRAETEGFRPVDEGVSRFNTMNTPFDLYEPGTGRGRAFGNTEAGDGPKFKGRGYLQITGRSNYAAMSARLGLGSLLIDEPSLAASPEISARILCAWLADSIRLRDALNGNDLAAVRSATNGGLHGLSGFTAAYETIYKALTT
jgi:predicted chitinase